MLTLDLEDYNSVVHLESPFIAPPTTLSRLKSFCCLVSSVLREWSALYTTHKMMMTTDSDSILLQSEIFQLYENQCVKKFFVSRALVWLELYLPLHLLILPHLSADYVHYFSCLSMSSYVFSTPATMD